MLLLDLDGFKPINDLHGHETGDKVLQQVALRFERVLPAGALLARLGGDEASKSSSSFSFLDAANRRGSEITAIG